MSVSAHPLVLDGVTITVDAASAANTNVAEAKSVFRNSEKIVGNG